MLPAQDLLIFEWSWVMTTCFRSPRVTYCVSLIHDDSYYLKFVDLVPVIQCLLQSPEIDVIYITTHKWATNKLYISFSLNEPYITELERTTKWE